MIDLTRFLFLAHRLDLSKTEHELVQIVALAFWPGGRRITSARIMPSWAHRMGAGAASVWASRGLRRLVDRGVLVQGGRRHEYSIQDDPARWDRSAPAEWAYLTDERSTWQGAPDIAAQLVLLLRALQVHATAHPADPVFAGWFAALLELQAQDGVGRHQVVGAMIEATIEPGALIPATPIGFALNLYALIQRWRRRDDA